MIQDQLENIIKRFKQNDYYQASANKQNNYRRQSSIKDQNTYKQQNYCLKKKIQLLEETIQKMTIDGNKMHRYYEQMICQSQMKFQSFRQEYNGFRCSTTDEKKQGENLVQFLNLKIEVLNQQITNKQEMYREILQKYQQLQQKVNEVHLQGSQNIKDIQKRLVTQSMHHEQQKIITQRQLQQMKKQLKQLLDSNQQILNENLYLKSINQSLAHNIQYLKTRLYAQIQIIHQQKQQQDNPSLIDLQRCDLDSISREQQDRFTLQEIKMNDSQQMNMNGQKQILNLSEHYSKFNRTLQFQSKEKSNYQFVITESHQRSFIKRQNTLPNNQNILLKIDTIQSKKEKEELKISKSRLITQVKQFKMQDPNSSQLLIDPYRAFFTLLIQSQKLNSLHFDKIFHFDISYLYDELINNCVPFNQWQKKINMVLRQKIQRKK